MNGRPGYGHGLEVVITRMCLNNLMSKDEILKLQVLPSFLDANSVERVAIEFLCSDIERHPKDRRPSFLAKVECMTLTFRIYGTRSRIAFLGIVY